MFSKASSMLRNDFQSIDKLAKETLEPIYITQNGEVIGVYMDLDAYERKILALDLKEKVLRAEEERLRREGISFEDMKKTIKG